MRRHVLAVLTAFFGASAVLLGAFGAHALAGTLDARQMEIWETAVRFQFWHALALALVALHVRSGVWRRRTAWFFGMGIVFFCGSLYALALGAPRMLGLVTPVGGILFLLGWIGLGFVVFGAERGERVQ